MNQTTASFLSGLTSLSYSPLQRVVFSVGLIRTERCGTGRIISHSGVVMFSAV